jgi:hypothetical protein
MNACRAKLEGREKPIELGNRAAADQRESAIGLDRGGGDAVDKTARDCDLLGTLGDIDQRSIDVEKESEPIARL